MSKVLFQPRARGGQLAPLTWPLKWMRRLNQVSWPLEDGVHRSVKLLERCFLFVGFIIFVEHNDAEFRYLRSKIDDIDQMLTGMPTYIILCEVHMRSYNMAYNKELTKALMKQYYAEIYIDRNTEPALFRSINRQMLPTYIMSAMYSFALLCFYIGPIVFMTTAPLYKMIHFFHTSSNFVAILLLLSNYWVGFIVVSTVFGEMSMLGEFLMHLNARFIMLRQEMLRSSVAILERGDSMQMSAQYTEVIKHILKVNAKYMRFATDVEQHSTFRLFVLFALSTASLCALSFKVYTNPVANVGYVFWFIAKTLELLALGNLGTILYITTDNISSMYYESNWEQIVFASCNTQANVRLMKLIVMASELNQKPFSLTGLKYFRVTLSAVVKILQGAFSYFTYLMTLR